MKRDIPSEVSQSLREGVALSKSLYEKSLRDRDDELNCELEQLSGNRFGQIIHLSCGCQFTIGESVWSHWHKKHRYTGRLLECQAHA